MSQPTLEMLLDAGYSPAGIARRLRRTVVSVEAEIAELRAPRLPDADPAPANAVELAPKAIRRALLEALRRREARGDAEPTARERVLAHPGFGVVTDGQVAADCGCTRYWVRTIRREVLGTRYSWGVWQRAAQHPDLGQRTDIELARELDCCPSTVRKARRRRGIGPAVPPVHLQHTEAA